MEVMHERVAGLDVHQAMIVACVRIMSEGKIKRECRTFETSTASLEALLGWLTASGCTHVAMEATGVYWTPTLISLLCSVPGINVLGATIILAEIGRDMSRFATAGHLLPWAGMCPGGNESAGKRKSSRLRNGAPWLKTILVNARRQRRERRTATMGRNSSGCVPNVARRRRSAPSPPRCSPRSTTC